MTLLCSEKRALVEHANKWCNRFLLSTVVCFRFQSNCLEFEMAHFLLFEVLPTTMATSISGATHIRKGL